MSSATYRAVQATSPGKLELVERSLVEPGRGEVRIRVQACGVCHSDAATVEGLFDIQFPRVPGHEAVGRIDALGSDVEGWAVGQRVGVGFLAGPCGYCRFCRRGELVACENQAYTGIQHDGGYAEVMLAKASGLISVPESLDAAEAAPLLCAGLTTFSALRNSGAKAGDLVAIVGIGGLGHLAVQFARHMGFEVVAIGRSPDSDGRATALGAHHYLNSSEVDVAAELQSLGGATVVLLTASGGNAAVDAYNGLRAHGEVITLGVTSEPVGVTAQQLAFKGGIVTGALTGDAGTGDATLRFSELTGVKAVIETLPLERAAEGYAKMMAGKARYRVVLTMDGPPA